MTHYTETLLRLMPIILGDVMLHTHMPSLICCGLQLTSCGSSGSIIGASSALGERAGDEESLFSHSVKPGMWASVSRKERFNSLMLVWCLTISAGGSVSYSSRSTMIQGDEGREQRGRNDGHALCTQW